jgi:hypothetical protein
MLGLVDGSQAPHPLTLTNNQSLILDFVAKYHNFDQSLWEGSGLIAPINRGEWG